MPLFHFFGAIAISLIAIALKKLNSGHCAIFFCAIFGAQDKKSGYSDDISNIILPLKSPYFALLAVLSGCAISLLR